MDESERLHRWIDNYGREESRMYASTIDEEIATRIAALLNSPKIDKYCLVDAYYYDYSVIPTGVKERFNLCRDCYVIYGITTEGQMISKWIDRWDLDSDDPIVDGKVIHSEKKSSYDNFVIPEICQSFNPKLLSSPMPESLRIFDTIGENLHITQKKPM